MTAIERTAYPRFKETLTESELADFFAPSPSEVAFVDEATSGDLQQFSLAVPLKAFQKIGYLPRLTQVPRQIVAHIAGRMQLPLPEETQDVHRTSRSRYRQAIHDYLGIQRYGDSGARVVREVVQEAAVTMSDPADLINVAIEQLVRLNFELPAFSTLDRLVNHIRHGVHQQLYQRVTAELTWAQKAVLDGLLERPGHATRYPFTRLKSLPKRASLREVSRWKSHLEWLEDILYPRPFTGHLTSTKVEQFAAEAHALELGDMRDISDAPKRYTLLPCLFQHAQVTTRDQIGTMFLKRMHLIHRNASERLRVLREKYLSLTEEMVTAFSEIVQHATDIEDDRMLGHQVRQVLTNHGGVRQLTNHYRLVSAYHNNNYLPLIWDRYRFHRALLFRMTQKLSFRSATRDQSVLEALQFIQQYRTSRRQYVPREITLDFASQRWQALIKAKHQGRPVFDRRQLEVCVFSYLAVELSRGDIYIVGSEEFADYRQQLLSWEEGQPRLAPYCEALALPATATEFVQQLRDQLASVAQQVDAAFSENSAFSIDPEGQPHLKRATKRPLPEGFEQFEKAMKARLPERHLLDILKHAHYWVNYTRHFGPPSGSDAKMSDAISKYLVTVFGYGCNLGAAQTARHTRGIVTRRSMKRIGDQHISASNLEAALRDVINEYIRFPFPLLWGTGQSAIADGTHIGLRENNLLGEHLVRYGEYGAIAYHHVSDTYIALFSHFIACGVWEAVCILDGLLKNESDIQPDTVHGDTQGQSEPIFGLAHLLGIQLMPRMRTWNKVAFYRPDATITFEHIDSLFTRTVNWQLIQTH